MGWEMISVSYAKLVRWELWGIVWIILVGSMLHFTFQLSGESRIVALFSAVNESVWEHLKLGYWSLAFYIVLEYKFAKVLPGNFFAAKTAGIVAMNLFIVLAFYSHKYIMNSSSLGFDVAIYMLGAVICQLLSIKLIKSGAGSRLESIGLPMFAAVGLVLTFFTFFPPELPVFRDSTSGKYGI